jgi:hypothetical protein
MVVDSSFTIPKSNTVDRSQATDTSDVNVEDSAIPAAPIDAEPQGAGRWSQAEPANVRGRRVASRRAASRTYEREGKENQVVAEPGWTAVDAEETRDRFVGLGMGRDVGRNMGNITFMSDGETNKGKKEKDKKSRRVYL